MAYVVMAYTVMAYAVMAYVVMAYVVMAYVRGFQVNLCLIPNSVRKRYQHLVFCIVGLKVDLEDHFP